MSVADGWLSGSMLILAWRGERAGKIYGNDIQQEKSKSDMREREELGKLISLIAKVIHVISWYNRIIINECSAKDVFCQFCVFSSSSRLK